MKPRVVILTISDTRTPADDGSGDAIAEELAALCEITRRAILQDDEPRIVAFVREIAEKDAADVIVTTGGTGIAPRDKTFEALESLFEKKLDGFGEAFRRMSFDEIGARAILSRATAGTFGVLVIFALPGSTKGARLGAKAIIAPMIGHAVDLVRGRTTHHGAE